ncbi:2-amino-4-hydroxy-6-hydroxymethyldihydropteridine diphosphokinase [Rhodohalobacter sp. 8-1]|uniref:2-amino-4-hydroxy-6- hydroxymethyldihydropteridine diphosphokinase n=1 Tax=Rhodohalobacter sp. 8-1 TaxID=3131972 RepID=UPI0030EEFB63
MEQVVVAVGSNLGDRHGMLQQAGTFLERISETEVQKSSIWESEPIGPSEHTFLNAAARIGVSAKPADLLSGLKSYERKAGRKNQHVKWGPRLLDLDIITYGNLVIKTDTLIIPHPEYTKRLFVLLPLREVAPDWRDPETGKHIDTLINETDQMQIKKTNLTW